MYPRVLVLVALAAAAVSAQAPPSPPDVRALATGGSAPSYGPRASITCPSGSVPIVPGQDIQAVVNGKPGATTFCLKAGVHRRSSAITPKTGNTFVGEYGAVLDGSTWVSADANDAAFRAHNQDIDDVTIRNLVIRDFPQKGIHAFYWQSDRWTIEFNEIAGGRNGVMLPNHSVLRGNYIHHNEADPNAPDAAGWGGGYGAYLATDVLIEANEIAWNGLEQKVLDSHQVTFRDNYVHDNRGDGVWYDGQNEGAIIEGNRAVNNGRHGLDYEAGLGASIRRNVASGNGENGVFLTHAQNVDLFDNRIEGNKAGGVTLFFSCAAMAAQPGIDLKNVSVHDNVIATPGTPNSFAAGASYTAECTAAQQELYFGGSKALRFTRNTYTVPNVAWGWWLWRARMQTWAGWQALGQDAGSTVRQ